MLQTPLFLALLLSCEGSHHRLTTQRGRSHAVKPHQLSSSSAPSSGSSTLTAFPSKVLDGGFLNITLVRSSLPVYPDDFISLSCGPTSSPTDFLDALSIGALASSPLPLTVTFTALPFLRCDWVATYWASSYSPSFSNFPAGNVSVPSQDPHTTPKQLHLSLTGRPTEMSVGWTTSSGLLGAPSVQYGPHGAPLTHTSPSIGGGTTYTAASLCGAPANTTGQALFRDPGLQHTALMSGLAPRALYDYRVGSERDGWSPVHTFRASPGVGHPVAFVAYGDQSLDEAAVNSTALVVAAGVAGEADFCLVNGDLGYALGSGWVWDAYGALIQPATASIPHAFQVGNHEMDWRGLPSSFSPPWWNNGFQASEGECGVPFLARYPPPALAPAVPSPSPFYYSFIQGDVFIAAVSSEQ